MLRPDIAAQRTETETLSAEASEATEKGSTPTGAHLSSGRRRWVNNSLQYSEATYGLYQIPIDSQSPLPIFGTRCRGIESSIRYVVARDRDCGNRPYADGSKPVTAFQGLTVARIEPSQYF